MRLINFSATNYRSITAAHKISLSNVTVLIGKNNEGKTNLLRALEAAMHLLQRHAFARRYRMDTLLTRDDSYVWSRDFPIQLQSRKSVKQTILKLEFLLDEEEARQFKRDIGASINGSLPLEIKIGQDQMPQIRMVKSGKNTKALMEKSPQIARFVAERIHFNYIPAIRTDNNVTELIGTLLAQELRGLEKEPKYLKALETISSLQQPKLQEIADRVQGPLKEFLPSIKSVSLEISENSRRYSLRRDVSVIIDDGTPTLLEYKGDGVKSLAALGLLKNRTDLGGSSILAIEEPESHLHPAAIHQVKEIIESISNTSQVIITTHNPLFVDRVHVKSNVLVTDGGAHPAKNISSIRDLLGIRASDNLLNANYVLVVEGEEDVVTLKALLPALSEKISRAMKANIMIIDAIGGSNNLSYKLSLLKNSLCATYVFIDGDDAGKAAYDKSDKDGLISPASCTFVSCHGMPASELEDCIDVDIYQENILDQLGVDLRSPKFRGNKKWSDRLKAVLRDQGKPIRDNVISQAKFIVAFSVAKNPKGALNPHKRNSIDALVAALERFLNF